jgi:hypothetical protein
MTILGFLVLGKKGQMRKGHTNHLDHPVLPALYIIMGLLRFVLY